jgi:hypothetical protein
MPRIRIKWMKNPKVAWGWSSPNLNTIYLDKNMDEKTLMQVALHEGLHQIFPYLDENAVHGAEKTLADVLWRIGYRLKEDD